MELRIFFSLLCSNVVGAVGGSSEGIKYVAFVGCEGGEYLKTTHIFGSQFEIRRPQLFSRSPFIHFTHPHGASNTCKVDRLLVMRHMDTTSQLKHLQRRGGGGGSPGVLSLQPCFSGSLTTLSCAP